MKAPQPAVLELLVLHVHVLSLYSMSVWTYIHRHVWVICLASFYIYRSKSFHVRNYSTWSVMSLVV